MNTMLVDIDYEKKIVFYYLSIQERDSLVFRESIRSEFAIWRDRGYTTCVFLSGEEDLRKNTGELLVHNLHVIAKKEVERRMREGVINV